MIKCLLSRPGLISGPLKPKPKLILTEFHGLTQPTPSLVTCFIIHAEGESMVKMEPDFDLRVVDKFF